MPQCCVVPFCSSRISGHRFPKDKTIRKKWLIAIKRDQFIPTKNSRVCKKHFVEEDYVMPKESLRDHPKPLLKVGAVPSQFRWTLPEKKSTQERRDRVAKRVAVINAQNCPTTSKKAKYDNIEEISNEITVESSTKDAATQCIDQYSSVTTDVGVNTILGVCTAFRVENFKSNSDVDEFKFYTGFDSYEHFCLVFNSLGPAVYNLSYYPTGTSTPSSTLSLTPANEFFLTMIKLRRYMVNKELAFRFKISKTHVSRVFITWINFLYCQYKELNIWAPLNITQENMKIKGKKCASTVIIDCTEIKIQKPKNPISQQQTYSTYKSCNTLKVLIGLSCAGSIIFISEAYGGSISDRLLFEKCGIIDLLQKDDVILADRGFQIQDLVAYKGVKVNTPEFLDRNSGQLNPDQLHHSKKISSSRIHIERIIGLAKT